MKTTTLIIYLLTISSSFVQGQVDSAKTTAKFELVKYYFVELKHGPNRSQTDSTEISKIQAGHMENIKKMSDDGFLLLAGPFGDEKGGGIIILNVNTFDEAKALCDKDPAIISGRLIADIRPWYTMKGAFTAETKLTTNNK